MGSYILGVTIAVNFLVHGAGLHNSKYNLGLLSRLEHSKKLISTETKTTNF